LERRGLFDRADWPLARRHSFEGQEVPNMTRRKATGRQSGRRAWWGAALLALSSAAAAGGCADHVQSAVVTCPCDTGVCCTSGVCATNENACEQATQALSSESAGRWTGYVESFTFASGADAVDLTLVTETDGSLSGKVILGMGTPPSPPTDPNLGWPAGYIDNLTDGAIIRVLEGVPYHVKNVRWTALRLRFEISLEEPWGPWCRLQQPIVSAGDPATFGCLPKATSAYSNNPDNCRIDDTPIDCTKLLLCGGGNWTCDCTADGCDASSTTGFAFDVALRGNEGNGSVEDHNIADYPGIIGNHNVRLIRTSN
jgi:hypothetical protein